MNRELNIIFFQEYMVQELLFYRMVAFAYKMNNVLKLSNNWPLLAKIDIFGAVGYSLLASSNNKISY